MRTRPPGAPGVQILRPRDQPAAPVAPLSVCPSGYLSSPSSGPRALAHQNTRPRTPQIGGLRYKTWPHSCSAVRSGAACWRTQSSHCSPAALLFDASVVPLPPNSLTYINFGIYNLAASTSTNLCMAGSCGRDPPGHVISFSLLLRLLVTQWGFAAAVKKLLEICYKWILSVL